MDWLVMRWIEESYKFSRIDCKKACEDFEKCQRNGQKTNVTLWN